MTHATARPMPEFAHARSGMLVGAVLGGIGAVGFGVFLIVGVINVLWTTLSSQSTNLTTLIMVGVFFVGAVVFGRMGVSSWRTLSRWQRMNERPVMASGTLGQPRRSFTKVNRRFLYNIPLTVLPLQGPPYAATASWFIPSDVRDFAKAGARVVVRIDPEDASIALVDWDQTRASWGLPLPPD